MQASADHLRTINRRRNYINHGLDRDPGYKGPAASLTLGQAKAHMNDLLAYFGMDSRCDLPAPPVGLPGTTVEDIEWEVMDAVRDGFDYFLALADDQPKRQVNIYQRMADRLAIIRREARRKVEEEYNSREAAKIRADMEAGWEAYDENAPDLRLVYFIKSDMGQIKIGIAKNPELRLKGLQTSHPASLALLVTCQGGKQRERAYHQQFAAHRLKGEWFTSHPDILAEIERLNA